VGVGHLCGGHYRDVVRKIHPATLKHPANGVFVLSDGAGTVVSGMRFRGATSGGYYAPVSTSATLTATDNVMDAGVNNGLTGGGTWVETGTQTNAEWEAGH
jgi:hypothetical protein